MAMPYLAWIMILAYFVMSEMIDVTFHFQKQRSIPVRGGVSFIFDISYIVHICNEWHLFR